MHIGLCQVNLGRINDGIVRLRGVLNEAEQGGKRRLAGVALANLGEAFYKKGDYGRARACFSESTARTADLQIHLHNSYYDWRIAQKEGNETKERFARSRMRMLKRGYEEKGLPTESLKRYLGGERSYA
ncbi:hypothetical protein ABI59_15495 [Acidobacteria bacterium Mor1]|nr:hypothetical protein ABI59_15495 [Acidobacteria bacterium Mor1]